MASSSLPPTRKGSDEGAVSQQQSVACGTPRSTFSMASVGSVACSLITEEPRRLAKRTGGARCPLSPAPGRPNRLFLPTSAPRFPPASPSSAPPSGFGPRPSARRPWWRPATGPTNPKLHSRPAAVKCDEGPEGCPTCLQAPAACAFASTAGAMASVSKSAVFIAGGAERIRVPRWSQQFPLSVGAPSTTSKNQSSPAASRALSALKPSAGSIPSRVHAVLSRLSAPVRNNVPEARLPVAALLSLR
mmetsp:Transcript_26605/g.67088  ORF Transcript_26605/g.67088 Transcript_26605/m.67088 type:complete len:246 (+) Transcript_26605:1621-2358(+)